MLGAVATKAWHYVGTGTNLAYKGLDLTINSRIAWLGLSYWITRQGADSVAAKMQYEAGWATHQNASFSKAKRGLTIRHSQPRTVRIKGGAQMEHGYTLYSIPQAKLGWRTRLGLDAGMGGAAPRYALLFLLIACGGGRIPLSGRVLSYAGAQTITFLADVIVAANCFYEAINITDKGKLITKNHDHYQAVARFSKSWPLVALGLTYFSARIADRWLMASMPVNTLPWESLISRLGRLSSWMH